MKHFRAWAFLMAFGGLAAAISPMWAETQPMAAAVTGQVISFDKAKHELTIRDEATQSARTFRVLNPDILQNLKSGDRVKVSTADEKTAESVNKS